MKTCVTLLCLTFCLMPLPSARGAASKTPPARQFSGDWFCVSYPASFNARPSLVRTFGYEYSFEKMSTLSEKRYDSAFFVSPDKSVEFYVYAPLEDDRRPTDYRFDPHNERLVSHAAHTARHCNLRTPVTWYTSRAVWRTAEARDGSYCRSWIDITKADDPGRRVIIGIKYKDRASYLRYKKDYEAFRKSLGLMHPCMS